MNVYWLVFYCLLIKKIILLPKKVSILLNIFKREEAQ